MQHHISITALGSISPLGSSSSTIWAAYKNTSTAIVKAMVNKQQVYQAQLPAKVQQQVNVLKDSNATYKDLDKSVLYALTASRIAIENAGWSKGDNFGINIGSSRGATGLFEKYHTEFLNKKKSSTLSSPTTTLGNISSWVAHDLKAKGPVISHSITCSTALHALLNGIAWLQAGLSTKFLVGGSEAPLTPFTIAQMQALKIYAKRAQEYPCRALDLDKKHNSMVLGEGAGSVCLELGDKTNALAKIIGIGYATEPLQHHASLSADAQCFQDAMRMALQGTNHDEIDVIVTHTPGTIKGDLSEFQAISKVFCNKIPFLTTNKWKLGHTFGASGLFSLEMAILMLQHQKVLEVPYLKTQNQPRTIRKILVNAVGFGGNAVSVLLSN